MGEALLSRLLSQQIYQPGEIGVSDPQPERRAFLANHYGIATAASNQAIAAEAGILLLAVKPQVFDAVARELQAVLQPTTLVISILAGLPLARLAAAFPASPVIRAMPNTPATVGAGMTAIAAGEATQAADLSLAHKIFQAVGEVVEVRESLMDAVTGLSGSGPAFVAIAIEALTDGGVAAGLPRAIAAKLALQTVLGTARLIQEAELHPAVLKDQVTSPGGTTIAGVAALEAAGLRTALIQAVQAAYQRACELGQ